VLVCVAALALGLVSGDGLGHAHGRSHSARRSGRQEAPAVGYEQPPAEYAADDQAGYEADAAASDADAALAMLQGSIPGVPGEDYPIYAEVPESGFACDGQVDGGYYADPEAECQAFHICTADGAGGLAKYSFLCPNGTLFNQNYFICDWWFNFDCSTAEELYSLNDEIAAERDALAAAGADAPGDYAAPPAEYAAEGSGAPEYEAPARRGRAQSRRKGRRG
jgi:syndecan 1